MLSKKFAFRFEILGILGALVFFVLVTRVAYMQLYAGEYYKNRSDGNRIRVTPIMAPRGIIYDRNGIPLVTNKPGFTVVVNAKERGFTQEVATRLAEILNVSVDDINDKVDRNRGNYAPVTVKTDLTPELVTKIEEHRDDLPGVMIVVQPLRVYLYNEVASHTIGYVNEISEEELEKLNEKQDKEKDYRPGSIIGKMGIERYYDNYIRGYDGNNRMEVDVNGRVMHELKREEPIPGDNIYLTIDIELQKVAEKAVDDQLVWLRNYGGSCNAYAASVVVLDPRTGEVLVMTNRPTFNPNSFVGGISHTEWNKINTNPFDPMTNKAVSGEYPQGSTFKIVTAAAALELNKITPEEKFYDSGEHWLAPKGNAGGAAYGWLDFTKAMSKSSNVFFFELGYRVGIDELAKYASGFGFGKPTGIDLLGEAKGNIASPEYKKSVLNEDWYAAETLDAAIGQGFHLATPLQMAVSISAVANGGTRYRPYLVSKIMSDKGELVEKVRPKEIGSLPVSAHNLAIIKNALRQSSIDGTGAQLANFPIPVAGKTGTAENSQGRDHGIYVCYAPADNPEIAIVVLVDQGGFASTAALPIAQKILAAYFKVDL